MKLLWQNKFERLIYASPLYYKGTVEITNRVINLYFSTFNLANTGISFNAQNGDILSYGKNVNKNVHTVKRKHGHFELDDFVFGNYTISHHGEWGYKCKKHDKTLWKKSLRGYLYTDMVLNQNNIVFGTAGYGGHFYSLNIETGEIVFDFNTKGTSKFFDVNNSYYFCSTNNRKTQILRIDYNGNILDNIEIDGAYFDYECVFDVCDNLLCVMTLKIMKKGNNESYYPIFSCIQL